MYRSIEKYVRAGRAISIRYTAAGEIGVYASFSPYALGGSSPTVDGALDNAEAVIEARLRSEERDRERVRNAIEDDPSIMLRPVQE